MLGIVETLSTAKIISSEMYQDHSLFGKNIFQQNTLNPCLSKLLFKEKILFFHSIFYSKEVCRKHWHLQENYFKRIKDVETKEKSKIANLPSVYFV